MASNKILSLPPIAVPAAVANLLNGALTSLAGPVGFTPTQPYLIIKHIRAVNIDATPHTFTLFKGASAASAAGTQFAFAGFQVAANSYSPDWFGQAKFEATDFLTGFADVASKIILNIDVEIGFA